MEVSTRSPSGTALSTSEIASLWNNGNGMLITTSSVPEPSSLVLLGLAGLLGWPAYARRHGIAGSRPDGA